MQQMKQQGKGGGAKNQLITGPFRTWEIIVQLCNGKPLEDFSRGPMESELCLQNIVLAAKRGRARVEAEPIKWPNQ